LRRLYSTFAGGWPGLGLLLMRLVVGSVLLVRVGPQLWNDPMLPTTLASVPLAGSGLLLLAGLWTPLAGTVVALIEISQILTVDSDPVVCLLIGTLAGALAMLGPGRWSADAQLFGWKRIDAPPRNGGSKVLNPNRSLTSNPPSRADSPTTSR
jgi:putative oxidoreductase